MPKTKPSHPRRTVKTVRIPISALKQMVEAGGTLADLAYDIMDENGMYSEKFLADLAASEADIKAGRVHKVESLYELLDDRER